MRKAKISSAKLKSAYQSGSSIRAIARRTGRSYGTVHSRLKTAGVKMRARGGPNHRG